MNIGIIDIGWKDITKETLNEQALGGSETWLLSVTSELIKQGHQVDLYCNIKKYTNDNNLTYIPLYNIIDKFNTGVKYDFVILNRIIHRFNTDIITLIRQYYVTDSIFIQMHDLSLLYEDHLINDSELLTTGILDPRVKGLIFLTKWHKDNFESQYPILTNIPKYIIPNGLDFSLIPTNKQFTDHRILWSSCKERGLDILINDIYPIVKEKIPDFGIDIAGYNDLSNINIQGKDIRVLGRLNKKELYKEINKHKVWFYPGTFAETFCITAIENIACGNIPITPFTFGMQDLISESSRKDIQMSCNFDSDRKGAAYEATEKIVEYITNYKSMSYMVHKLQEEIKKYTWSKTAEKYIDLYKEITYKNITTQHHYKGIFLSQSSNIEFFKNESDVVEQTWAKNLIDGEFPGYTYFRYTSCDEQHPNPCIDNHIIYVENDDTLKHTYEKMRDAYRLLLKSGYTFDYIFRTNTSTYINVVEAIGMMNNCNKNENAIVSDRCGYYHRLPNGILAFQFNCFLGNAYIMSKKIADSIFLSRYDSNICPIDDGDDIVANYIVNELYDQNDVIHTVMNPSGPQLMCYKYKCLLDPDNEQDQTDKIRHTTDPDVVYSSVSVSVRIKHVDYKVRLEHGEYDHMRELHERYMKPHNNYMKKEKS